MPSRSLQETVCRAEANAVLDEFMVGAPDEIDLDTVAWRVGHLEIENGQLDSAEGRLITGGKGGTIRVSAAVTNEGRRRFIIGHELGHFRLHKAAGSLDTAKELHTWGKESPETEANIFAGELLMPEKLLVPRLKGMSPSLAAIDKLATEFRTSNLATAVQFITYTKEPCALVVVIDGKMAWMRKGSSFDFFIPFGKIHEYSAAGELLAGKSGDTKRMVAVPAGAWLDKFDPDGRENIYEDARAVPIYKMIVSLLWIRDELPTGAEDGDET